MFAKQQAASALNKASEEHNAQLQKGIEIGLEEAEQAEPVRRSDTDTHDIGGTETKMRRPCSLEVHADARCVCKQCGMSLVIV